MNIPHDNKRLDRLIQESYSPQFPAGLCVVNPDNMQSGQFYTYQQAWKHLETSYMQASSLKQDPSKQFTDQLLNDYDDMHGSL